MRAICLILLLPVFMFSGAVIGMYFQPPALQKFYALTGLKPGAGSASPIALPPEVVLPKDMAETMRVTDVVGLPGCCRVVTFPLWLHPMVRAMRGCLKFLVAEGDVVEKGASTGAPGQ